MAAPASHFFMFLFKVHLRSLCARPPGSQEGSVAALVRPAHPHRVRVGVRALDFFVSFAHDGLSKPLKPSFLIRLTFYIVADD